MLEATLLVLAGGSSRRMRTPKALLPVAGRSLLEWVLDRLAGEFPETLVAAAPESPLPAGVPSR